MGVQPNQAHLDGDDASEALSDVVAGQVGLALLERLALPPQHVQRPRQARLHYTSPHKLVCFSSHRYSQFQYHMNLLYFLRYYNYSTVNIIKCNQ